ncbi:MAG: transcriptional repressor [Thiotrichales bacterium]|nr:transcriptional repressor [Thiotrichales bacterium]
MTPLQQAKQICASNGQNLTPIREAVFSILLQGAQPMSAYEILDRYRQNQPSGAQPPTIYRALAFLEENGLIHRMASTRQFLVCDHLGEHHAHDVTQFFICDACGAVEESIISHALWHEITDQAAKIQFQVKQPSLEIHGVCRNCRTGVN